MNYQQAWFEMDAREIVAQQAQAMKRRVESALHRRGLTWQPETLPTGFTVYMVRDASGSEVRRGFASDICEWLGA
jgi:hypothetical protein